MELSQYVRNAIVGINFVEKDHDSRAISIIKEASVKAPNQHDAHILDIVGGSLSMTYKGREQVFAPILVWNDGSRSFSMEDISQEDIEILQIVIQVTESSWVRTRLSHIVWVLTKDPRYGQLAVTGYIEGFHKLFDPERWTRCFEQICTAYFIASTMGKNTPEFKRTRQAINQKLIEMNGTDSLFLSLKLLRLVMKDATKEDLAKYDSIVCILSDKNFNTRSRNTNLADETFSVLEALYKRLKKDEDIKNAKARYASYYEVQAKVIAQKEGYFRAIDLLKKACTLFSGINREKSRQLRLLLEDWQKLAMKELHPHKFTINVKAMQDTIEQLFDGLTQPEAIVQFGRVSRIYDVDNVKKQLQEKQEEFIFSSMIGNSLLNQAGQSVRELPPLNDADENMNPDALRQHMVRHVSEQREMVDYIPVVIAFQKLRGYGSISEEALDFLVSDNAIVPENRAEIIRAGIHLALSGKLYAAMHILLPQTEHIFRHLVKMCGDTVTFLKEDGTEEFKPLSSLFKSDKLIECYDSNILFTFQSIMDEPAGENLRNLNGHGLLEPQAGNGTEAIYFLSLLIKLLSMYGSKTQPIRRKLFERDKSDSTKLGE